jgi:predicted alpha-1,6-mannanase (GH76 family)
MKTGFAVSIGKYIVLSVCILSAACLKQKDDEPTPPIGGGGPGGVVYDWPAIADSAQTGLNFFWSASGKYFLSSNSSSDWAQYWPNAHGLDVLVDAYLRSPSPALKTKMTDLIDGVKVKNGNTMINFYYDDMEWMALACLRAYKATGDASFKTVTDELWSDIKTGWSNDLGGGIWWRKDNSSKNTPSNMPAAILAARLCREFNNPDDLEWAKKIYDWQKTNLYDASSGWVYDNVDKNGVKNTSWKFTYNQGVFLGAAMELFAITSANGYLQDAIKATDYAVSSGFLITNGILKDEGGGDGGLFKGVFIRYFTRMIVDGNIDAAKKTSYIAFLKKNAETLWSKGTNKTQVLFGSSWENKPGTTTDLTIQLSGVMLIEAMAELKKLKLVE